MWGSIGEQVRKALEVFSGNAQAEVVVNWYNRTASLASGDTESQVINPPSGKAWKVLGLHFHVANPSGASSGDHRMKVRGETGEPEYIFYISNYGDHLTINRSHIDVASAKTAPDSDAGLAIALSNIIATPDEGIELYYYNNTDVSQDNTREFKLRFLEIPLERLC